MLKVRAIKSKHNQNSRTKKQKKSKSLSSEFPFQTQTSIPGTYGKDFFFPSPVFISVCQYYCLETLDSFFTLLFLCLKEEQKAKIKPGFSDWVCLHTVIDEADAVLNLNLKMSKTTSLRSTGRRAPTQPIAVRGVA